MTDKDTIEFKGAKEAGGRGVGKDAKRAKRRLPILARHAVSLALAFAIALPVSYHVGVAVYQEIQLKKLFDADQQRFEQGLSYVYKHAADRPSVSKYAMQNTAALPPERGARLLIALCKSDAQATGEADIPLDLFEDLTARMQPVQAIALYDQLLLIPNRQKEFLGQSLLDAIAFSRDTNLLAVVDLLEQRYVWSSEVVPPDKWLAWLAVLAGSDVELTQGKAARLMGKLPDEADNPLVLRGLEKLAQSRHAKVRARVLTAAAGYASIAKDPVGYEQIIFELGQDEDKEIARRAWMIVGHLNPLSGFAVDWKDADPFVAEAMLWAAVKTNPQNPKPAIDAWQAGFESTSAFALHEATPKHLIWTSPAGKILYKSLETSPVDPADVLRFWRSLPALHDDWETVLYEQVVVKLFPTLLKRLNYEEVRSGPYRNVFEAVIYYGRHGFEPKTWDASDQSLVVAWIEGLHRGPLEILNAQPTTYYQATGELMTAQDIELYQLSDKTLYSDRYNKDSEQFDTLLAAAGSDDPRPQFLQTKSLDGYSNDPISLGLWLAIHAEGIRYLAFDDSKMPHLESTATKLRSHDLPRRTAAALYCGMIKYKPTLITGASASFLRNNPDLTRKQLYAMSDAELTKLGLSRTDALTALLKAAESAPASAGRQPEAKMLRLALWMRGDLGDEFTERAEAMLLDDTLPTSTVLMCLLHMKRPIALDYLFGDLVEHKPGYLNELFIHQRYWHVFRRFVDTSDLTLWLWGDAEAQAFQLEAMRQWYAVNRWKIQRGGWPTPKRAGSE